MTTLRLDPTIDRFDFDTPPIRVSHTLPANIKPPGKEMRENRTSSSALPKEESFLKVIR